MIRICVMASGNGSNFQAIIEAQKKNKLGGGKVVLLISDNPQSKALVRAKIENIPRVSFDPKGKTSDEIHFTILEALNKHHIDLVCMAGYMRILEPLVVREYENRIMNLHPSLLPSFRGLDAVGQALDYGVKVTGCTVHFVNLDDFRDNCPYDLGPIIVQKAINIDKNDNRQSLLEKIHKLEHIAYPEAIRLFCKGRLKIDGRKIRVV